MKNKNLVLGILASVLLLLPACTNLDEFKILAGSYNLEKGGEEYCPKSIDMSVSEAALSFVFQWEEKKYFALNYSADQLSDEMLTSEEQEIPGIVVRIYTKVIWDKNVLSEYERTEVKIWPVKVDMGTRLVRRFAWSSENAAMDYYEDRAITRCQFQKEVKLK